MTNAALELRPPPGVRAFDSNPRRLTALGGEGTRRHLTGGFGCRRQLHCCISAKSLAKRPHTGGRKYSSPQRRYENARSCLTLSP